MKDYSLKSTGTRKSTIANSEGKLIYDVLYKGNVIAKLSPYSSYKETKKNPKSRIVDYRRDVTKYEILFTNGPKGRYNSYANSKDAFRDAIRFHTNHISKTEESIQVTNIREFIEKSIKESLVVESDEKKVDPKFLKHVNSLKRLFGFGTVYFVSRNETKQFTSTYLKANTANLDTGKVFQSLKKQGYKKTKGYDPEPNDFNWSRNVEDMTARSDNVILEVGPKEFYMVGLYAEHGKQWTLNFEHRKIN